MTNLLHAVLWIRNDLFLFWIRPFLFIWDTDPTPQISEVKKLPYLLGIHQYRYFLRAEAFRRQIYRFRKDQKVSGEDRIRTIQILKSLIICTLQNLKHVGTLALASSLKYALKLYTITVIWTPGPSSSLKIKKIKPIKNM